jgi:hypothetical protein
MTVCALAYNLASGILRDSCDEVVMILSQGTVNEERRRGVDLERERVAVFIC